MMMILAVAAFPIWAVVQVVLINRAVRAYLFGQRAFKGADGKWRWDRRRDWRIAAFAALLWWAVPLGLFLEILRETFR